MKIRKLYIDSSYRVYMVQSLLYPDIIYDESSSIEKDDEEHEGSVYEVNMRPYHLRISVLLGKERRNYIKDGLLYCPVYLVSENEVHMKVGVYEIPIESSIVDGSYDLENGDGNLLWFSEQDEHAIRSCVSSGYYSDDTDDGAVQEEQGNKDEVDGIQQNRLTRWNELYVKPLGNFSEIKLEEESSHDAKSHRERFTHASGKLWVQQFMKNSNYDIVDNDGNGECFFYTLRDALRSIGYLVSTDELRSRMASQATEDTFVTYKELFDMYTNSIAELSGSLKGISKTNRAKKNRDNLDLILENNGSSVSRTSQISKDSDIMSLKAELKMMKLLYEEVAFMKDIEDFQDFIQVIQTPDYWCDAWGIQALEKALQVKCIILSQEAYHEGDYDNVLRTCDVHGDCVKNGVESLETNVYNPKHYVLLDYDGIHYRLIRYHRKGIFRFSEIPYDLKNLIVLKCLEYPRGQFSDIVEFSRLIKKYDTGMKSPNGITHGGDSNLPVDDTETRDIFQIYEKSNGSKIPGKGSGEYVHNDDYGKYNELHTHLHWRRKLSYGWQCEIKIGKQRYASPVHYVESMKFRQYPEFQRQFTLESKSAISKTVEKAVAMGQKNSKVRHEKYQIDPQFIENKTKYIQRAMDTKYEQYASLRSILIATKDAYLMQYCRGKRAEPMKELMTIRAHWNKILGM